MPWTTPETFTAGQTLTAASMNALSENVDTLREGRPSAVTPMCSATIATTTGYTQDTDISWTIENYDTDAMFAPTSSTITIKTAGVYLVMFSGRATSTSSATYNAVIRLAGANDAGEEYQDGNKAATSDARWTMSAVRKLAVNDTVTARLQWTGTVTLQGGTTISPTLTATWLGPG